MPLNQGQQEAVDAVLRFLISDEKEFAISGPAGTGKTFVMKHIMTDVLDEYTRMCELLSIKPKQFQIELTATTNKAAEVLNKATGFPASTIHSFLHLKVRDNYNTGTTDIVKTPAWEVYSNKLIFIDEASMIDSKLHGFIQEATDRSCKIIYLGDASQLAPVSEVISPVYANPLGTSVLSEPMRNAGQPALMYLCQQLRETVETLTFKPIPAVPGIIDYLDPAPAQAFVDRTFKQANPDARLLCYTNEQVRGYNAYIRALRGYPDHFVAGEKVINNQAIDLPVSKILLRAEQELTVASIDTMPRQFEISENDPNTIPYYNLTLDMGGEITVQVKTPIDPDWLKTLSKHYAREKAWGAYFKIKNNFPDLRPRDASTVHKSQGSTFHTAILDLSNIGTCRDPEQVARMLYVGASRATDRLVLIGQLPPHYQSAQFTPQRTASCPAPSTPSIPASSHMTPSSPTS